MVSRQSKAPSTFPARALCLSSAHDHGVLQQCHLQSEKISLWTCPSTSRLYGGTARQLYTGTTAYNADHNAASHSHQSSGILGNQENMSSCHVLSGTDRSHDLSIRGMVSGSSFRKSRLHKAVDKECNGESDKLFKVKGKLCCLVYYECRT